MKTDPLFTATQLGSLSLKHRIVMAPLTRLRSLQPGDIPQELNAEYYGQRASEGGLIISEATDVSPTAHGSPGAPGIYSDEQIAGWKLVTHAVHAKGGLIVNQIWHTGRISHSSMQPSGQLPAAPSAIASPAGHMDATGTPVPSQIPRALRLDEIADVVTDFALAAHNAMLAGFDGVEIHGANGYLIDQFLQTGANQRTDEYGGSIENRTRFLLQVVDAIVEVLGADRVGLRLSPFGSFNGIADTDGTALWDYAVSEVGKRKLAYLHIVEPRADPSREINALDPNAPDASSRFKAMFGGPVISAGGYVAETARAVIEGGCADAVAFGRLFIANPDLPQRLRLGASLNPYHRPTFYGGTAKGYTDYPFLETAHA